MYTQSPITQLTIYIGRNWQKPVSAETCFCRTGLNRGLNHLWQKPANPA